MHSFSLGYRQLQFHSALDRQWWRNDYCGRRPLHGYYRALHHPGHNYRNFDAGLDQEWFDHDYRGRRGNRDIGECQLQSILSANRSVVDLCCHGQRYRQL